VSHLRFGPGGPDQHRAADLLLRDLGRAAWEEAIAKTYGRRGAEVVARNHAAVDATLEGLHQIEVPSRVTLAGRR
jgi:pyruvate-ferredoxin/flavodoxin oxidoreductase